ncbi:MAG: ATP-binding protein [Bacteroidales bacterium]|jgi:AAA+ ATPase superfamily predicted ATPase|nr:ATP-binding protein [Bacteroidales bacterium]
MIKFINRISEQHRLKKAFSRETVSFVVLYGRRRCGKTRLLREILISGDLYFMADQSEAIQQRMLLAKVISNVVIGFDKVIYPDWETLFDTFNLRIAHRTTLCLDEFPYLVKSSPELPAILQKLIDNKALLKFNLIICGSSQQLMHGLVLDSSAPLFGRADEIIKIKPMKAPYIQEILGCSSIEAIEEYSVWGGIPRYWELRLTENNLGDALKYHLFNSQGILYDEPMRLFLDDMRDTVHSFTILSLIATGCHRLSEIAGRIGKPATHLANPLDKLLSLGYIEREVPFGENYRNSKKSLYKIADPFLDFYFHYVVPHRSFIETEQDDTVLKLIQIHFSEYVSFYWEKLCREAVSHLNIDGITFNPASRWWGSPAKDVFIEIDVVAISHDEKFLLLGECKWSEKKINKQEIFDELMQKGVLLPFAQGKTIIPVIFSKNIIEKSKQEHVFFPDDILLRLKL